jgi:hypothetical protein
MQSVTDMAYVNGKLFVAGLSNEEFSSKLWAVPYPFVSADRGTSVEIFHGNHGRLETRSPVYTFIPYTIDNQPYLIGGYLCTPLVKFPLSSLTPGAKVQARRSPSWVRAIGRSTWCSIRRTAPSTCSWRTRAAA